ncbi:MAG: DUF2188 domain-containing protein [Armatimonadota bacterium]
MPNRAYHAVPDEDGWAVKREGNKRATSRHETQKDAWDAAREWARKHETSAYKHGMDGTIKEERSYGSESPRPG